MFEELVSKALLEGGILGIGWLACGWLWWLSRRDSESWFVRWQEREVEHRKELIAREEKLNAVIDRNNDVLNGLREVIKESMYTSGGR